MKRIWVASALAAITLVLSGCVVAMGNRDLGKSPPRQTTVGQELLDLKKAKDAGALTEEEYQAQRARILDEKHCK